MGLCMRGCREHDALEDAATVAHRKLADCRAALAEAQGACVVSTAAAQAVGKERDALLQRLTHDAARSTLVEQVRPQWHPRWSLWCRHHLQEAG